jgi:gas vesicle protein
VVKIEQVGGFIAPWVTLGRYPTVVLYADGRLIMEGPQIEIYPGPALPNLQVTQLTPADLTRPTPCAGWTLHGLLAHMTTQHYGFAAAAAGQEGSHMADDRGSDAAGYLGWFFLGGVVGAAAALLLAPRTGQQTRELLAERGNEFARRAQELATGAQGRAGEWMDKSRELFEEQTQRLMTAFEAGRDAMRDEMRKGPATPRG